MAYTLVPARSSSTPSPVIAKLLGAFAVASLIAAPAWATTVITDPVGDLFLFEDPLPVHGASLI